MIDISFLRQLDRFNIILKKRVHSAYAGSRESKAYGSGLIFKDHREYVPGDDLRAIDWKVYARTDHYFIKQYEEERNMNIHIILDASASMDFGRMTRKFEYAAMIGLGFAYMGLRNNEKFEISTFSDSLVRFRPRKGNNQLMSLLDQLNNLKLTGKSQFYECISKYKDAIRSKSVVVIVSDFLFDLNQLKETLYRFKKSEVTIVQVLDEEEINLSLEGDVKLFDAEEPKSWIRTYISNRLVRDYETQLHSHNAQVKSICDSLNMKFLQVSTHKPIFETFFDLMRGP